MSPKLIPSKPDDFDENRTVKVVEDVETMILVYGLRRIDGVLMIYGEVEGKVLRVKVEMKMVKEREWFLDNKWNDLDKYM